MKEEFGIHVYEMLQIQFLVVGVQHLLMEILQCVQEKIVLKNAQIFLIQVNLISFFSVVFWFFLEYKYIEEFPNKSCSNNILDEAKIGRGEYGKTSWDVPLNPSINLKNFCQQKCDENEMCITYKIQSGNLIKKCWIYKTFPNYIRKSGNVRCFTRVRGM